jgi:ubiquinone biosynthesis protein COQ4
MTAAAVLAGQRKMSSEQRVLLMRQYLPWAARAGAQCTDLMNLYYEEHLDENLDELRERWRIITAPNTLTVVSHGQNIKPIVVQTVSV